LGNGVGRGRTQKTLERTVLDRKYELILGSAYLMALDMNDRHVEVVAVELEGGMHYPGSTYIVVVESVLQRSGCTDQEGLHWMRYNSMARP
jgi:hypothetical protein